MDATRRSGLGRSPSIRVGSAPVSLDHMCVFVSRYCCGVSTTVICLEGFNGRGWRQMDSCWTDVDQHFNRVYIQNCSLQADQGEAVAPACVERFSTETEMKHRAAGLDVSSDNSLQPDYLFFFIPFSHDKIFLQGISGSLKDCKDLSVTVKDI